MPLKRVPLGIRSNPNRNDTQAIVVNGYAEPMGQEAEGDWALYACDGFTSHATLTGSGVGVVRGWLNFDDATLYVVAGQRINRISSAGAVTDMAALATTGAAYLARNRKSPNAQIGIVTSDGLFRLIENNAVSTPTVDPDIGTFNSLCGTDGYFIYTKANGEWFISSIDEGATIDELEFSQANTNPDNIIRGIVRGRDVLIAGPRSFEAYQNTGATDFPFERVTSLNIGLAYGPAMVNLAAVVDGETADVVIFPGNNSDGAYAGVMLMAGYQPRKISTADVDRCVRDETDKTTIRAFTRIDNGHVMYCLTGSTFTREYNCDTGLWHNRESTGLARWRVVDAVHFNGQTLLADYAAATVYRQASGLTPVGASTVTLRHSSDNGRTWKTRGAKSVGSASTRRVVRWPALGQSKEDGKVLELTFSNALNENGVATDLQVTPPPIQEFPRTMAFNEVFVSVPTGTSGTGDAKGFYSLAVDAEVVEA